MFTVADPSQLACRFPHTDSSFFSLHLRFRPCFFQLRGLESLHPFVLSASTRYPSSAPVSHVHINAIEPWASTHALHARVLSISTLAMDSQTGHKGPPLPFARPTIMPVSQNPPIPPPPYSAQSTVFRQDLPPRPDPFIPSYPRYNSVHISSPALARHGSPFASSYDAPFAPRFGPSPPSPHYQASGMAQFGNVGINMESRLEEHRKNGQHGT